MRVGRAVGIVLLSVVDAFVPTAVVTGLVFVFVTEPFVSVDRPVVVTALVATLVFAVTIGFGLASAVFRDRPFPVTRAVKRVADWWPLRVWP
ncbi:hypothetical protein ACFOZ7_14500 [Natribaculum luteum]|uniref:Uncharacterized protein n=1 Tax=Natribaculum luteum TaxID=1586232 RepID=A0ABD5P1L3_9EURY|nr:hypothetical protein [Natribaculum luteum]